MTVMEDERRIMEELVFVEIGNINDTFELVVDQDLGYIGNLSANAYPKEEGMNFLQYIEKEMMKVQDKREHYRRENHQTVWCTNDNIRE